MEEYRFDIKVRNNIILYKIEKAGYKTVGEFCRLNNIMKYASNIGDIINMKSSPLTSVGKFQKCIIYIADILNCSPFDFFTETQLNTILKTNKRSIQVNEAEMKFMVENSNNNQKLLEELVEQDQLSNEIENQLETLTPREQKVINMRFGLGEYSRTYELEEISKEFGISRARVRHIEHKALRKMRHPDRADKLREYTND